MINQYLMFNGNCMEAVETYKKAFNGEVKEIQLYKDMPQNPNFPMSDLMMNRVLHCKLEIDGFQLMMADGFDAVESGNNQYVSFVTEDMEKALSIWKILKEEGTVFMEMSESFFSKGHGSLKDKFGINWMFTVL